MTAIRKLNLQYTCFQHFTSKTTEIGYSNDRFGINFFFEKNPNDFNLK